LPQNVTNGQLLKNWFFVVSTSILCLEKHLVCSEAFSKGSTMERGDRKTITYSGGQVAS
jgi:hypothetical protein